MTMPAMAQSLPDIVDLVENHSDPVVSVRVKSKPKGNNSLRGIPKELLPFFSPELSPFFRGNPNRQPASAIGSGFIIEADGYVLTNAHVVADSDEIIVTLKNGEEYTAKLVGSDKRTDVALLKIDADKPLPTVKVGDSEKLRVGQWVVAIGSPWGLDQTVTAGIVSALGRRLPRENYVPFIQTDAAINPGNSGGPLMDLDGKVIGINSQIISPVKAYAGLSFAIPINVVMNIQSKIREDGFVRRARLGVLFSDVSKTTAEAMGLVDGRPKGALIQDVVKGSAASEAGLQSGDIILSLNDVAIEKSHDLPLILERMIPGETAKLEVLHEGKIVTITAVLDSWEDDVTVLGMKLGKLDEKMRIRLGIERDLQGVFIISIENKEGTPVDVISQLRNDDVITGITIKGRLYSIADVAKLQRIINNASGAKAVAFRIWRKGSHLIIPINLRNNQ